MWPDENSVFSLLSAIYLVRYVSRFLTEVKIKALRIIKYHAIFPRKSDNY